MAEDFELEKVDWNQKFKQFLDNYVDNEKQKRLMINYYSLAKRKAGKIEPSEFSQIYDEIFNDILGFDENE